MQTGARTGDPRTDSRRAGTGSRGEKRADELKDQEPEKSGDHFRSLCKALGEVLAKPGESRNSRCCSETPPSPRRRCKDIAIETTQTRSRKKKRIDETVLPPLLRAFAFNCFPLLKDERREDQRQGGVQTLFNDEEKSLKATKRMVAKMRKEIAGDVLQAQEDENTRWEPVSASDRVLRATFVCKTAKADEKSIAEAATTASSRRPRTRLCERRFRSTSTPSTSSDLRQVRRQHPRRDPNSRRRDTQELPCAAQVLRDNPRGRQQ